MIEKTESRPDPSGGMAGELFGARVLRKTYRMGDCSLEVLRGGISL